jgi:hypothetical protein
MTRYDRGGGKITTLPTRPPTGGQAASQRQRFDHLMAAGRPAFADDPTLDLPCQRPDSNPDWWFEAGYGESSSWWRGRAIALCHTCPMQQECRDHAIAAPRELYGVWGGVLMERPGRPSPTQRKGAGS